MYLMLRLSRITDNTRCRLTFKGALTPTAVVQCYTISSVEDAIRIRNTKLKTGTVICCFCLIVRSFFGAAT